MVRGQQRHLSPRGRTFHHVAGSSAERAGNRHDYHQQSRSEFAGSGRGHAGVRPADAANDALAAHLTGSPRTALCQQWSAGVSAIRSQPVSGLAGIIRRPGDEHCADDQPGGARRQLSAASLDDQCGESTAQYQWRQSRRDGPDRRLGRDRKSRTGHSAASEHANSPARSRSAAVCWSARRRAARQLEPARCG